jgi:hypothetical protein
VRLVLLTTSLPRPGSEGDIALRSAGPDALVDVIDLLSAEDRFRLARYSRGDPIAASHPGFWTTQDLERPRI